MANISGLAEPQAEVVLWVILGYILGISLLIFLHNKLLKKHKKNYEHLTLLYDTVRYTIAKAQYNNSIIQESKWINITIEADHKSYLANTLAIKQEILSIEQQLGQQIISVDQWMTIDEEVKKTKKTMISIQILGRIITVLTVGIYKLFW